MEARPKITKHQVAQAIAMELFNKYRWMTRERAVTDAFDAVEEATGIDLSEERAVEIGLAKIFDAMGKPSPRPGPHPADLARAIAIRHAEEGPQ